MAEGEELNNKEQAAAASDSFGGSSSESNQLAQHENQVGSGYKPGGRKSSLRSKFIQNRKRKWLLGGGIAALLATIAIFIFLALLPLKILHIVNNLQNRFYSTSHNAMNKETDRLLSSYIKNKIKLGHCKKVIDSSCNPFTAGDSLVNRLYRGWSNGHLEDKLWTKYGVQVRLSTRGANSYELEVNKQIFGLNSLTNGNKTIDEILSTEGNYSSATRNQIRQVFRDAFEGETRAKKVMYYIKVSKLLESKYGIKFCVVGCFGADKKINDFRDWKDDKKRAAKMFLAQRVLVPRVQIYQLFYACLLDEKCTPEQFTKLTPSDYQADINGCKSGCDLNGEALTEADHKVRDTILVSRLLSVYGGNVDALRADYEAFKKDGILGLMQRQTKSRVKDGGNAKGSAALDKLLKTQAIQKAQDVIPVVGQINMAAVMVRGFDTMSSAVPKMVYVMNSTAAAQFFSMYRTHADEIKEGKVDATIVGSFTDSLGSGVQVDSTASKQIGGLAEAEHTPLYQTLIGNTQTKTSFASLSNLLSPKTYAASSSYTCKNGQPVPAGQLICPEEKIHQNGNVLLQGLTSITQNPVFGLIRQAANVFLDAKHGLTSAISEGLKAVCNPLWGFNPISYFCKGIEDAANKVISIAGPFLNQRLQEALRFVLDTIFGFNIDMISNNMSGGRSFDMLAAGADVSGNDFAHNGLGGRVLSKSEVAAMVDEQAGNRMASYKNQSFFARMFDQNSEYSPISRLAMSMPTDKTWFVNQSILARLTNPLSLLFRSFGALLPSNHAAAFNSQVITDPFGITQYGYPADDPVFKEDPDTFWRKYCTGPNSFTQAYNEYAAAHPDDTYTGVNGVPDNSPSGRKLKQIYPSTTGTNGCLLIQAAVGSAGAVFTDDVLAPNEKTNQSDATGGGGGGADQSPGSPPAQYAAAIAAHAPGRSHPEISVTIPPGAVPSDGRQYFAAVAHNGEVTACSFDKNKHCIYVKYRDPPGAGNTIEVPID